MTVTQLNVSRHFELFNPYEFHTPVHIIGAGATGSWLALMLAKLGITDIIVWDFDKVEEHNIPNQAYSEADIGKFKVDAIFDQIKFMTGTSIRIRNMKVEKGAGIDGGLKLPGIVFCMVDSMTARREIWENFIKYKSLVQLFVEPRMGLDVGRVYNVNPMSMSHIKRYEETYYGDDVTEVSACGVSMTVITSALATASWCARQLINFASNGWNDLDNEILIDYKYNNLFPTRWEA